MKLGNSGIDEIDRKILRILQNDGRASTQKIADRVGGLSKVAIAYRIRRLIKSGVIQGFYARVDPDQLRQNFLFITRLALSHKGPQETQLLRKIAAVDGIQSVFQTFGDYDAIVIGRASNATAARDIIDKILHHEGVRGSTTTITHTIIKQSLDIVI